VSVKGDYIMSNKYNKSVTVSIMEGFVKGLKKGFDYGYDKEVVEKSVNKLRRAKASAKRDSCHE
jgi:hypothetical protein